MGLVFQKVPSARFPIAAKKQDGLCVGFAPKDAGALEAQIDHPPNGTLDATASHGKLECLDAVIAHPGEVFHEVVALCANLRAVAPAADLAHSGHDLLDLALQ
jgi:hypothetical protein